MRLPSTLEVELRLNPCIYRTNYVIRDRKFKGLKQQKTPIGRQLVRIVSERGTTDGVVWLARVDCSEGKQASFTSGCHTPKPYNIIIRYSCYEW